MRAERCSSGGCFHGGIAPRPLLIFQKSSPSVSLASFFDVQSAGFGGGSAAAAGPSPLPLGPWHVAQFCSASFLASARSFASPFLAASGFLVFFASAGAFHSPCAQTPETTPIASAAAAAATIDDLRNGLMGSPLAKKKIVNGVTISRAAEGRQHVLHSSELHAGLPGFPAAPSLDLVEPQPVLVRKILGLPLADQPLDGRRRRIGRSQVDVARQIFGHAGHRSRRVGLVGPEDRKSTRLNSSHSQISYAVFCLKKKKNNK